MLKRMRSILGIGLSVVLAAACLSGCGGNGGKEDDGNPSSVESIASGNAGETEKETGGAETGENVQAEGIDLQGREITMVAWGNDLFGLDENAADERGQTYWARKQEVEEKYNCKFVFNVVNYDDILPSLRAGEMSGTPYADIVVLRASDAQSAYKEGLLLDLSQVLDGSKFYQPAVNLLKEADGKFYTLGVEEENHVENLFLFNQDLFEAKGIDVPALYQEALDGKWTYDRLIEVAEQVAEKENGVTKIYGAQVGHVYDDSFGGYLLSFDADPMIQNADGTYSSGFRTENMERALETLSKIVQNDSFWYKQGGDNWDVPMKKFLAGEIAMTTNGCGIPGIKINYIDQASFKIGVLPMPKPSEEDDYVYNAQILNVMMMPASLGKDMETAQAIADMITYIFSPIEGSDTKELLRNYYASFSSSEGMVEVLLDAALSENFKTYNTYTAGLYHGPYKEICNEKLAEILNGETSIKAGIDAFDDAWQAVIDEYNAGL